MLRQASKLVKQDNEVLRMNSLYRRRRLPTLTHQPKVDPIPTVVSAGQEIKYVKE